MVWWKSQPNIFSPKKKERVQKWPSAAKVPDVYCIPIVDLTADGDSDTNMADTDDLEEFDRLHLTRQSNRNTRNSNPRSEPTRIDLTHQDTPYDSDGPPGLEQVPDLTTDSGTTTQESSDVGDVQRTPESERTAENGYIVIRQTPLAPYDQDADPAGLYGGREVDNRPSLMEFYHQDARTNQIFATMAPTQAELAARAEASAAAARNTSNPAGDTAMEFQRSITAAAGSPFNRKPVLKLRTPKPLRQTKTQQVTFDTTSAERAKARFNLDANRREVLAPKASLHKGKEVHEILNKWQKANDEQDKSLQEREDQELAAALAASNAGFETAQSFDAGKGSSARGSRDEVEYQQDQYITLDSRSPSKRKRSGTGSLQLGDFTSWKKSNLQKETKRTTTQTAPKENERETRKVSRAEGNKSID